MRTVDGENAGAVQLAAADLPFDADERPQTSDAFGKSGLFGRQDDSADILVGAGRLLSDAAHRRATNHDSPRCKIIDDLAPAPLP
jgi:hypothetical protein